MTERVRGALDWLESNDIPLTPPFYGTFGREAVVQADEQAAAVKSGGEYNLWNGMKLGDRENKSEPAATRCVVLRDAGETAAAETAFICLHFAKGACVRGKDCTYLHRLPEPRDEQRLGLARDIFGREKHGTEREDMQGTGSFERNCRNLYIGRLRRVKGVDLEALLFKNFVEWGEIEYTKVFPDRGIAFVRYRSRVSAEFAMEAMRNQSLGYKEVLNVRWAFDDPNPAARRREALHMKGIVVAAARGAYLADPSILPEIPADLGVIMANGTIANTYEDLQNAWYDSFADKDLLPSGSDKNRKKQKKQRKK